ncbi:MAE_28990/MAE_18760 family HEPN-like nuclease [Bacillus sp. GX]|uniref:MAE_28990/MAE_18760 family HEPN-like nuclease n=1 Tax=Bacillus sp. GX TaxID=3382157 RepID=UPI0038CC114A
METVESKKVETLKKDKAIEATSEGKVTEVEDEAIEATSEGEVTEVEDEGDLTYAGLFIEEIEERWNEIDLLIEQIGQQQQEDFKNVLCRSTVVLLVAHLEGFIKEAASTLIKDMNHHVAFYDVPKAMKKTYSTLFLSLDKGGKIDNLKQKRLIEEFEQLNAKLDVEPFLFEQNKNPSPANIEKILSKFGVTDFFKVIHKSKLDIVFENNMSETRSLLEDLKDYTKNAVRKYPYEINLERYDLQIKEEGKLRRENSLWSTFLDDLLYHRHSIAHGSNFINELEAKDLMILKNKVHIFQFAITLVLFSKGIKNPA